MIKTLSIDDLKKLIPEQDIQTLIIELYPNSLSRVAQLLIETRSIEQRHYLTRINALYSELSLVEKERSILEDECSMLETDKNELRAQCTELQKQLDAVRLRGSCICAREGY